MMNYGLDESQEEAIKWAIERLSAFIDLAKENIENITRDIAKLNERELTKERRAYNNVLETRRKCMNAKLENWQAHKKTLEEMLPVTLLKMPMYSDNEGNTPLK